MRHSRSFLVPLLCLLLAAPQSALAYTPHDHSLLQQPRADVTVDRRATTALLPFNVAAPGATPSFIPPALPILGTLQQIRPFLASTNLNIVKVDKLLNTLSLSITISPGVLSGLLSKRLLGQIVGTVQTLVNTLLGGGVASTPTLFTCLNSTASDQIINSLLAAGGAYTIVYLCPSAVIPITNAIQFTAPYQGLATRGLPTGDTRATLKVMGATQSCAVFATGANLAGVQIQSIQIDGNRPGLGWMGDGIGLIEMGGNSNGHVVKNVRAFEPRGWTAFHAIEGNNNQCRGVVVQDSQFGPAGQAPTGPAQFRRQRGRRHAPRQEITYPPGQWADGLSIACGQSTISNNVITDATDGGIVIFGAAGSRFLNNKIATVSRQALGGINMVDFYPWYGDYTNTLVQGNTILSQGAMVKLGMAVGTMTWFSYNDTAFRTFGASVKANSLVSGSNGYFGIGIAVAGVNRTTVTGNTYQASNYGGVTGDRCIPGFPPPTGPVYKDPYTTSALTISNDFKNAGIVFGICTAPGDIVIRNV